MQGDSEHVDKVASPNGDQPLATGEEQIIISQLSEEDKSVYLLYILGKAGTYMEQYRLDNERMSSCGYGTLDDHTSHFSRQLVHYYDLEKACAEVKAALRRWELLSERGVPDRYRDLVRQDRDRVIELAHNGIVGPIGLRLTKEEFEAFRVLHKQRRQDHQSRE